MKKLYKIVIFVVAALMLFTSCNGGDVVSIDTTVASESVSESSSEQPTETQKAETTYKNLWTYKQDGGVSVREITVNTDKGGDDVVIVQLTDMHLSWVNDTDLKDPVINSTYNNRKWGRDGEFWDNAKTCLDYAEGIGADQIVLTGDIYDYLTSETVSRVNQYIFNAYDNIMACLGNHEAVRKMEGTVNENTSFEDRLQVVSEDWCNDIYYSSKVLGNKVMLIQMDNGSKDNDTNGFWDSQVPLLQADLATARQNGYKVLIFYHIPMSTGNAKYYSAKATVVGDKNGKTANFYTNGVGSYSTGASKQIYDLITNNGDIIAGTFCGHKHCDFYTEINAKTADGKDTVIPQYILIGTPYGPNALKITVK